MSTTQSNSNKPSILKSTRESKGLTLEIVHEATKIPMDALRAIEEGYSVRILSPFYYRGFIKIYSEFLGLDVGEMYKQYGLDEPAKPVSVVKGPNTSRASVAGRPNVALEHTQEWASHVLNPKNLKTIFKVIAFLFLLFLLSKIGGCIASHMHKKVVPAKKQSLFFVSQKKSEKHKKLEETKPREEAKPLPPVVVTPVVKHEAVAAPSVNSKVEVAVRAIRNTWIQVKVDGNVVFQMTLNKGAMENWSGNDRIELSGRNIEQLDMEVNGKHVGSLGGGERRIRKVLITQEGLTVKK